MFIVVGGINQVYRYKSVGAGLAPFAQYDRQKNDKAGIPDSLPQGLKCNCKNIRAFLSHGDIVGAEAEQNYGPRV